MNIPAYSPPINVAFKKRIADKVGWTVTEAIAVAAVAAVTDFALVNKEQRIVLPENIVKHFEIDENKYTIIAVVLNGEYQSKTNSTNFGTFNNQVVYGFKFKFADHGYDPNKPVIGDAVYDAPVEEEEGRGVEEREVTAEPPKNTKVKNK